MAYFENREARFLAFEFDSYTARIASRSMAASDGFHNLQERNLLKEAVYLLKELGVWWTSILHNQQAYLQVNFDSQAPSKNGAYASPARQNQFSVTIAIEFIHHLVRDSIKNMTSLPEYDVKRSVLSAAALILFHEVAHVIFGHTETVKPESQDYRIDEYSADFNSGMLFVKSAMECDRFRIRLNFRQPDDVSRYACVGALVLHRYLHTPENQSSHYHGANNRFAAVCAGYMGMAVARRLAACPAARHR